MGILFYSELHLSTHSFANVVAGQKYQIPLNRGESATAGVLNASGTKAFIGTSMGRLLDVTLAGGKTVSIVDIIPQVPYLAVGDFGYTAPGSLVRLSGSVTGTTDSLQGRLRVDGVPVPILSVDGNNITAQVPWEARTERQPV
jgi:hypothetical protein